MAQSTHAVPVLDIAILAVISLFIWMTLYIVGLAIVRLVTRAKKPFMESLLSGRTLAFLIFSIGIISLAVFQFYSGLKN